MRTVEIYQKQRLMTGLVLLLLSSALGLESSAATRRKPLPKDMAKKHSTVHFDIYSDIEGKKLNAKEFGSALEQQYRDFVRRFRIKYPAKGRLPIYIFQNPEDFANWRSSEKKSDTIYGVYDPNTPSIGIRWEEDVKGVYSTLFHEVTHYFIDMALPKHKEPPIWMNEGLAVYFESGRMEKGRLITGEIPQLRLVRIQTLIKQNKHLPLERLIRVRHDQFDLDCYAQSWALVYFFAKADGGRFGWLFGNYLSELRLGRDNITAFQKAFRIKPNMLEPKWKKFILSLKAEIKGSTLNDNAMSFYNDAVDAYNVDEINKSLKLLEKTIKADPKFAMAYHLRGRCFYHLDQNNKALESFNKTLELEPGHADSMVMIAFALRNKKATDPGSVVDKVLIQALKNAIEAEKDSAVLRCDIAQILAGTNDKKLKNIKNALKYAREAIKIEDNADTREVLAFCLFQAGRVKEAVREVKKIIASNPKNKNYYRDMLDKMESHLEAPSAAN